jgi:hypothetical protein
LEQVFWHPPVQSLLLAQARPEETPALQRREPVQVFPAPQSELELQVRVGSFEQVGRQGPARRGVQSSSVVHV